MKRQIQEEESKLQDKRSRARKTSLEELPRDLLFVCCEYLERREATALKITATALCRVLSSVRIPTYEPLRVCTLDDTADPRFFFRSIIVNVGIHNLDTILLYPVEKLVLEPSLGQLHKDVKLQFPSQQKCRLRSLEICGFGMNLSNAPTITVPIEEFKINDVEFVDLAKLPSSLTALSVDTVPLLPAGNWTVQFPALQAITFNPNLAVTIDNDRLIDFLVPMRNLVELNLEHDDPRLAHSYSLCDFPSLRYLKQYANLPLPRLPARITKLVLVIDVYVPEILPVMGRNKALHASCMDIMNTLKRRVNFELAENFTADDGFINAPDWTICLRRDDIVRVFKRCIRLFNPDRKVQLTGGKFELTKEYLERVGRPSLIVV